MFPSSRGVFIECLLYAVVRGSKEEEITKKRFLVDSLGFIKLIDVEEFFGNRPLVPSADKIPDHLLNSGLAIFSVIMGYLIGVCIEDIYLFIDDTSKKLKRKYKEFRERSTLK